MNKPSAGTLPTLADSLPACVQSFRGTMFDPRLERWTFHEGVQSVSLNFALMPTKVSMSLITSIKRILLWYAENLSSGQLMAHFTNLKRLLEFIAKEADGEIVEIDAHHLMNYRASLTGHKEWFLGAVSSCLKKWHEMGIPGVTTHAVKFLSLIRLKGSEKGKAILTMDSRDGPFTDIELQSISAALNDGFSSRHISLEEYVLAYLFLLVGQRNKQFALMKVRDVHLLRKGDGTAEYVIDIPRVKQGTQNQREEFKQRVLTPAFGLLLHRYKEEVRERFEDVLEDPLDAPLFPAERRAKGQPKQFEYHRSCNSLGFILTRVISSLKSRSERTGELIRATATRFRRTIGTRAAREGHGELIIAELLDHTDTQNAGVYVRATPEIIERIDKAISFQLAPLADAFKGKIISDERQAIRGDDPTSRIVDPRFNSDFKPMGNCGRHGLCQFLAPIACYTCKSFQAWSDGAHEKVLSYLIDERERLMKSADERIASVNDRTILAVAEVVLLCRKGLPGVSADE